jgi:hypothetical protein
MANIKVSQAVDRRTAASAVSTEMLQAVGRRTAANDETSQAVDRQTAANVVSTEMLQAVYRQTAANADEPENVFTEERHGQHKSYTFATEKKLIHPLKHSSHSCCTTIPIPSLRPNALASLTRSASDRVTYGYHARLKIVRSRFKNK